MKTTALACFAIAAACAQSVPKDALLFHASFDKSLDADFAKGDPRIYTAPNYKEQHLAKPGLDHPDAASVDGGKRGRALQFRRKNTRAVFFKADKNTAFDPKNWSGTISFWLNLDPETDLEPGFCDPIQVTDSAFNDSAIWVDFTKDEKPRHFRLGVFGDRDSWNPQKIAEDKNPAFNNRLVVVKKYPFKKGTWTHVAIVHTGLGSGKGTAALYLNGEKQGEASAIVEVFSWDMEKAALRVGVNYVGLFDEFSVYARPLSDSQVRALAQAR
jgi:hypothetical protein